MQQVVKRLLKGAMFLFLAFCFLGFSLPVFAQQLEELPTGPEDIEAVLKIINTITNWVFAVLMTISVIMIMLAGFQFVMEGKDPAKVTEAKNKVLYAIGGMAIALMAKGFEPAIRNLLGL